MPLIRKACCKYRPSQMVLFKAFRASKVPPGGWTMENFTGTNGRNLVRDIARVRTSAMGKGMRTLAKPLAARMTAQVEEVCRRVETKLRTSYGISGYQMKAPRADVSIPIPVGQAMWADAINAVFADEDLPIERLVRPALQSAAADVADKTSNLLGVALSPGARRSLTTQIDDMARQVTRINDTTRENLARIVARGMEAGKHPIDVIADVRKRIPEIATNRVPTIVRTEMGRAADVATIRSMKDSAVVTHVSVIGCEAVEPGIPTFRGVPTCNIKNVPIVSSGDLRFHINHTGAIVASGFKTHLGQTPDLPLRGGEGAGTFEDRGRPVPALINERPPGPPVGGLPPPAAPPPPPSRPSAPPPPPVPPAAPLRDKNGFPVSVAQIESEFEDMGSAGGTTGARLVRDKVSGERYVVKRATSMTTPHLEEEDLADRLYRKAGVPVPDTKMFRAVDAPPVKMSRFIENGVTLEKFLMTATQAESDAIFAQLQKHTHIDAFLANWDMAGLDLDNILISGGKAYRIDNGGALRFRAQGTRKGDAFLKDSVPELWSMRNQPIAFDSTVINAQAQMVLGGTKAFKMAERIRKTDFLALIEEVEDVDLKKTLQGRAIAMVEYGNRGLHYAQSGIRESFFDEISYEIERLRAAKYFEKLPKLLKWEANTASQAFRMFDEDMNPWDGLRRRRPAESILTEAAAKAASVSFERAWSLGTSWGSAQASDSWSHGAIQYKRWLASKKFMPSLVRASYEQSGDIARRMDEAASLWAGAAEAIGSNAEQLHKIYMVYQAGLQSILERVEMPNVDRARRVMRLTRTESSHVMRDYGGNPDIGDEFFLSRGLNESTSINKVTSVEGYIVTEQIVPFARINGHYVMGGQDSADGGFFCGDGENEVTAAMQGIRGLVRGNVDTEGRTVIHQRLFFDRPKEAGKWNLPDEHLVAEELDQQADALKAALAKDL